MHALVNFANHGLLPFVGRRSELNRLRSFCTTTADTLRAGLVIGEAGSGKSRLFDELLAQFEGQGIVTLRTRLHPGAGISTVQLLARALRNRPDLRPLLPGEIEATLPAVVGALERLARLRQTVLVVEDIHLLEGDGLREFARLVDALGDEPLSLLLSARPLEPRVRGVIEPRLTLELHLNGLTAEALSLLWSQLFSNEQERGEVEQLVNLTAGNALAVRSALRAALRLVESDDGGDVQIVLDRARFAMMIGESVRVLSEGIAAHLTSEEREAAERLAVLGEVFSVRTAQALLGDIELLDRLVYRGIIATALGATAPLRTGQEDRSPLAFTHSLLHRHLVEQAAPDGHALLRIIADTTLPIYTVTPWTILERTLSTLRLDTPEEIERALDTVAASGSAMSGLQPTPNWHLGIRIGDAGAQLSEHAGLEGNPRTRTVLLNLMRSRLTARFRTDESDEFAALSELYIAMTENLPDDLLYHRVSAIAMRARHFHELGQSVREQDQELEALAAQHPDLRRSAHYLLALSDRANRAMSNGDDESLRATEQIVDEVAARWPDDDELQRLILSNHRFPYLNTYNSQEELARRFRQAHELRALVQHQLPHLRQRLLVHEVVLHRDAGIASDLERIADEAERLYREHGMPTNIFTTMCCRYGTRALRSTPLDTVASEMIASLEGYSSGFQRGHATHLSYTVMEIGLFVGDIAWAQETIERIAPLPMEWMIPSMYVLSRLADGATAHDLSSDTVLPERWRTLAGGSIEQTFNVLRELLPEFLGVIQRIIELRSHIALVRSRTDAAIEDPKIKALLGEQLRALLDWLGQREYAPAIEALLADENGTLLEESERERWSNEARAMRRTAARQSRAEETRRDTRYRLTMLERIELHDPDGATISIRGGRMKAVLGLLVAARISRHAPDKQEFYMLAAGDEGKEFELARKTVNMAISSLRKTLGDDAFLRDDDTIHLNLDRVVVDLLEVWESIDEARRSLKSRSFARARTTVLEALEAGAGRVAFPSLYDSYFEAAREDFEARLRSTAIDVGRALLAEGDAAGSEEVLRRGFAWLPDDEEIGGLLADALRAGDHRAEAELVKLRTRIEA